LIKAVKRFKSLKFDPDKLIKNAQRFSKNNFKKDFIELVEKYGRL